MIERGKKVRLFMLFLNIIQACVWLEFFVCFSASYYWCNDLDEQLHNKGELKIAANAISMCSTDARDYPESAILTE